MTRKDYMLMIRNGYIAEHGTAPIDLDDLYIWAKKNKMWEPKPRPERSLFKEEAADALRGEEYIDPQNQAIRKNYPVIIRKGGEQQVLWGDIVNASDKHMRIAMQQKRR